MNIALIAGLLLCLVNTTGVAATVAPTTEVPSFDVSAGEYIFRIAGCKDCHSKSNDQYLAGGYRLATPFGVFYTPNITPDVETGIGKWTLKDFKRALRKGRSPNNMVYYPVFPYRAYTKLTNQDIANMWAYLRTVPAIRKQNRDHVLTFPFDDRQNTGGPWASWFSTRSGVFGWQIAAAAVPLAPIEARIRTGFGAMPLDETKTPSWNRGAYLVEAAFHCTECHTPRVPVAGLLKVSQWMSGANFKLNGHNVPNITPDVQTGLGKWTAADWDRFLRSGHNPQLKTPGVEMAAVVRNAAGLTAADRAAVTEYMMSLPPVRSTHED